MIAVYTPDVPGFVLLVVLCLAVLVVAAWTEWRNLRTARAQPIGWAISMVGLMCIALFPIAAVWWTRAVVILLNVGMVLLLLVPYERRVPWDWWMPREVRLRRTIRKLRLLVDRGVAPAERRRRAGPLVDRLTQLAEPHTERIVTPATALFTAWMDDADVSADEIRAWWDELDGAITRRAEHASREDPTS